MLAPRPTRGRLLAALASLATAAISTPAGASPAVDGTRNLSMGNGPRASAYGSNAALINPAAMSFSQQFSIEPLYQIEIQSRRNGVGAVVMDSLNNSRVALGLGYLFMRGAPRIQYQDSAGEDQELTLSHFGHEAFLTLSVAVVKQWLSVAIKPKYQYASLRYRDDEGKARNANKKLNFFGMDLALGVNFAGWAALHVTADNLVGNLQPAFTCKEEDDGCAPDRRELSLTGLDVTPGSVDHGTVSRVSDYPLLVAHGLAIFPLRSPNFSINFDGTYDFTSYRKSDKFTRMTYGGSAEFVAGPVPIRAGAYWDSRGPGKTDDRTYVTAGLAYVKPAKLGSVGLDVGLGLRQQVAGLGPKETVLGLNIGLRIRPDL